MSDDASLKLKQLQEALEEYHENYEDIPIVHTVLSQLLEIVNDQPTEHIQTNEIDSSLFFILPYSLWPSSK